MHQGLDPQDGGSGQDVDMTNENVPATDDEMNIAEGTCTDDEPNEEASYEELQIKSAMDRSSRFLNHGALQSMDLNRWTLTLARLLIGFLQVP